MHLHANIYISTHVDLFWASCNGSGGNFSVVTEFGFEMVQVYIRNICMYLYIYE